MPRCKGAGVNIDPVWMNVRIIHRGVPVNNYLFELLLMGEEVLTNPQQVLFTLLSKRNAWPHAGMNEMKVATGECCSEALKETKMLLGKRALQGIREPCPLIWIDA